MDVERIVKLILAEQLGLLEREIKGDSKLADLGADSLDFVEIVLAIEDEFSITLPDEEAEKITTVQQAIDCVKGKAKL